MNEPEFTPVIDDVSAALNRAVIKVGIPNAAGFHAVGWAPKGEITFEEWVEVGKLLASLAPRKRNRRE